MKRIVGGKEYDYKLCSRCQIWILTEKFENGTHEKCDIYLENLKVRKRAERTVLHRLS